jgi:hypothetical protein
MRKPLRGRRDERGQVGGLEALAFGLLIFVLGSLVVANAWAVVDAKFAADTAARQAARTYVETGQSAAGASRAAQAAGLASLTGWHRTSGATIDITADYRRCGRVVVRAASLVPYVRIPLIGATRGGITVAATHAELVDPYRNGVPGEAECT